MGERKQKEPEPMESQEWVHDKGESEVHHAQYWE